VSRPEFSRPIDRRQLKAKPVTIEADEAERKALARRFGLVAIERLAAEVTLIADGKAVDAAGTLKAAIVQTCAVSGDDLPVAIREPIALRFVPQREIAVEELELKEEELDEIPFTGHTFDLGEAVAQSLALAIDPYATGPEAERVREEKGLGDEAASGPLAAALAGLKKS
jgi:uncharacterized metal-binding protein YceD (DUF177 family)